MDLQFRLTEADYASANWAYLKRHRLQFVGAFRYPIACGFAAIVFVLQRPDDWRNMGWAFAIAIGTLAYMVFAYRWSWRQRFREMSFGQRLISVTINGESMTWHGRQEVTRRWDEFGDIYESSRVFLFAAVKRRLWVLPKSAMNEFQIHELKSLISANARGKVSTTAPLP